MTDAAPVKLAVVVTAYNRADFVGRCLASVLADESDALHIHVWVMDNGSTDDTAQVARAAGDAVTVLRTPDNRHIVEVLNRGFEAAYRDWPDCDFVLVMNEDTAFEPGSVATLVQVARDHPNALITALQRNYREPEKLDANARALMQRCPQLVEDAVLGRSLQPVYDMPTLIGACLIAPRPLWQHLGEWDPLFFFYGVDDDMCTRARWHRYRTVMAPHAHLLHAHGKLGADAGAPTRAQRLRKWRNETQARFLFHFKNPERALWRTTLDATAEALNTVGGCLRAGWPRGAWHALRIYGHLLRRLGAIAETRRRHFPGAPGACNDAKVHE